MRLLNISGLKLNDLSLLNALPDLIEIIANDNHFENSEYIASSIGKLLNLRSASFVGCPAQRHDIYYRNKIILDSKSLGLFNIQYTCLFDKFMHCFPILLEVLDDKIINEVTRCFLKNFDRVKAEQKLKFVNVTNANSVSNTVDIDLRDDIQLDQLSDTITSDVLCKHF